MIVVYFFKLENTQQKVKKVSRCRLCARVELEFVNQIDILKVHRD